MTRFCGSGWTRRCSESCRASSGARSPGTAGRATEQEAAMWATALGHPALVRHAEWRYGWSGSAPRASGGPTPPSSSTWRAGAGSLPGGRLIPPHHGRPQPGILRLEGTDPFPQGLNLVQQVPDRAIEKGGRVPSPWRFGRRGDAHDGGWPYVSVPRSGIRPLRRASAWSAGGNMRASTMSPSTSMSHAGGLRARRSRRQNSGSN